MNTLNLILFRCPNKYLFLPLEEMHIFFNTGFSFLLFLLCLLTDPTKKYLFYIKHLSLLSPSCKMFTTISKESTGIEWLEIFVTIGNFYVWVIKLCTILFSRRWYVSFWILRFTLFLPFTAVIFISLYDSKIA